jgi:predicted  nucleic acid-binding Zn-ribbon protein
MEMFERCGRPVVDSCLSGYNGTIFCYGQTGSGKTHTMTGAGEAHRGLIPRILDNLFQNIDLRSSSSTISFSITCSFLEIYNEKITDLLNHDSGRPSSSSLALREDIKNGVYVEDLTQETIRGTTEAMHLLKRGLANRHTGATAMNEHSSRSHSVFTVTIRSKESESGVVKLRSSRLNLIDLAGSERQQSTGAEGDRLTEACSINKSLSALGKVIMSLVDIANGKERHVHYRDSKLTFLLKDSLGGNSKTCIVANVSPAWNSMNETLSTLQFAQRAKFIKNQPVVNEDTSAQTMQVLQNQIAVLSRQLQEERAKKIIGTSDNSQVQNQQHISKLQSDIQDLEERLLQTLDSLTQEEVAKGKIEEKCKEMVRLIESKDSLLETTRFALKLTNSKLRDKQGLGKEIRGRRIKSAPNNLNPLTDIDGDTQVSENEENFENILFGESEEEEENTAKLDQLIQSVLNPEQHPNVINMAVKVADLETQLEDYDKKFGGDMKEVQRILEYNKKMETQITKVLHEKKSLEQKLKVLMNQSRGSSRQDVDTLEAELEMIRKSENEAWEKYESQKRENDRLRDEDLPQMQLEHEQMIAGVKKEYEDRVDSLQNEVQHLRNDSRQAEQFRTTLEKETQLLRQQYASDIDRLHADHQNAVSAIQEQLAALSDQHERERQLTKRQHETDLLKIIEEAERLAEVEKHNLEQIDALNEAIKQDQVKFQDLQKELDRVSEYEKLCAQMVIENEKISEERDFFKNQVSEYQLVNESQHQAKLKLQEELKSAEDDKVRLFEQLEAEREKNYQCVAEISQLSQNLDSKREECLRLEEQLQTQIATVANCETQISTLQQTEQSLKESIQCRDNEIVELKDSIKVLQEKVESLELKEKQNYQLIQEAEQFRIQKRDHIRKENTLHKLEVQVNALSQDMEKKKQALAATEEALRRETTKRVEAQNAENHIREKFHQQTAARNTYQEKYTKIKQTLEGMQTEVTGVKQREEETKKFLQDQYEQQLIQLKSEKSNLFAQMEQLQSRNNEIEKEYASLLGHNNTKQKIQHFVKTKEENATLFSENAILKQQIAELSSQVSRKEGGPRLSNQQNKTGSRPSSLKLEGSDKEKVRELTEVLQHRDDELVRLKRSISGIFECASKVSRGFKRRRISSANTEGNDVGDADAMCSLIGTMLESIETQAQSKELHHREPSPSSYPSPTHKVLKSAR